jgi:hypothetical protein
MKPSIDMQYLVKDNDGDAWAIKINYRIESYPDSEVKFIATDPAPTYWIEDFILGSAQVPDEVKDYAESIMNEGDSYLDAVKAYEESLTFISEPDTVADLPKGDTMERDVFFDTLTEMEQDSINQDIMEHLIDQWYLDNYDEGDLYAEHEAMSFADNATKGRYNRYYGLTAQDEYYFMEGE